MEESEQKNLKSKDTYTITKVTLWQGVAAILAIAAVFMFFTGGASPPSNIAPSIQAAPQPAAAPQPTPSPTPSAPARIDTTGLSDDDAVLGDANAPVTIVSFEDFQCPFCRRSYTQTFPQLKKDYIDTGKVKFVYRDFPLSFHAAAQKSAEAAECADDQEKYWEMHAKIFDEQAKQGQGTVQYTANDLKQWAADIGLDAASFNECLDSGKYASEVQKDFSDGQRAGVTGTPAYFINGVKLVGAQPYQAFKQIIDSELANSGSNSGSKSGSAREPSGTLENGVRVISGTAFQYDFDPNPIVVNRGERVRITMTSTDVAHGIGIPDYGINEELPVGKPVTFEFNADKAGSFPFMCTVFCGSGHMQHRGTLIVNP